MYQFSKAPFQWIYLSQGNELIKAVGKLKLRYTTFLSVWEESKE